MPAATSGRAGIPVKGNASHRRAWAANPAWTTTAITPHASVSTVAIAPASLTVSDSDGDRWSDASRRLLASDAGRASAIARRPAPSRIEARSGGRSSPERSEDRLDGHLGFVGARFDPAALQAG